MTSSTVRASIVENNLKYGVFTNRARANCWGCMFLQLVGVVPHESLPTRDGMVYLQPLLVWQAFNWWAMVLPFLAKKCGLTYMLRHTSLKQFLHPKLAVSRCRYNLCFDAFFTSQILFNFCCFQWALGKRRSTC